jgi:membrane protein involved in colicin uptake
MSYQSSWFLIPQHPNYNWVHFSFFALLLFWCNYVVLSVVPEDGEAGGWLEGIVLLDAEAQLVLQVRAERHAQQESSGRQQEFQHEKEHNQAEILVNI